LNCCLNLIHILPTFITKAKNIHKNRYNYSLVEYVNSNDHLMGHGCPNCKGIIGTEKFIKMSNKLHNNKYDYSNVIYKHSNIKIKIICPNHGIFEQTPSAHLRGHGCSKCCCSRGETLISYFLNKKNINFIREKKFDECKDKNKLPFDFYLPDYNMCIEYDGIQHFESIEYWGGEEKLKWTQNHDKIKKLFCKKNNIELIRIKYNENIDEKLSLFI